MKFMKTHGHDEWSGNSIDEKLIGLGPINWYFIVWWLNLSFLNMVPLKWVIMSKTIWNVIYITLSQNKTLLDLKKRIDLEMYSKSI